MRLNSRKFWFFWGIWMIATFAAAKFMGWAVVMRCEFALLLLVLLHQRFVKGRSWRSILLGDRPRDV